MFTNVSASSRRAITRSHWNRIKASSVDRIRRWTRQVFAKVGLDVHELGAVGRSLTLVLRRINATGWRPQTVIDVGVAYGTLELYDAFPLAHLLLVEPAVEWHSQLKRLLRNRSFDLAEVAAWNSECTLEFNVYGDPGASSILEDGARRDEVFQIIKVPARTLDQIFLERKLQPPILLKIDTQGTEYNVLEGATKVLSIAEVVLLECTFIENYTDGALFDSIYMLLRDNGYSLFDVFGGNATDEGRVLRQADVAFVRVDSSLGRAVFGNAQLT